MSVNERSVPNGYKIFYDKMVETHQDIEFNYKNRRIKLTKFREFVDLYQNNKSLLRSEYGRKDRETFLLRCSSFGKDFMLKFEDAIAKDDLSSVNEHIQSLEADIVFLKGLLDKFKDFFKVFKPKGIVAPVDDIVELFKFLTSLANTIDEWDISRAIGMMIAFNSDYASKHPKHNIKNIDIINELAKGFNQDGTVVVLEPSCERFDDIWGLSRCSVEEANTSPFVIGMTQLLWGDEQSNRNLYTSFAYWFGMCAIQNTIKDSYRLNGSPLGEYWFSTSSNFFEIILGKIKERDMRQTNTLSSSIIDLKTAFLLSCNADDEVFKRIFSSKMSADITDELPEELKSLCLRIIDGDTSCRTELFDRLRRYCSDSLECRFRNYAYTSCFGIDGFVKPIKDFREFLIYLTSYNSVDLVGMSGTLFGGYITRMIGLAIVFSAKYAKEHPEYDCEDRETIIKLAEFFTDNGSYDFKRDNESFDKGGSFVDFDEILNPSIVDGAEGKSSGEFSELLSKLFGDVFSGISYGSVYDYPRFDLTALSIQFIQIHSWESAFSYERKKEIEDLNNFLNTYFPNKPEKLVDSETLQPAVSDSNEEPAHNFKPGPRDFFGEHFSPRTLEMQFLPLDSCYDLAKSDSMLSLMPDEYRKCIRNAKAKLVAEGYGDTLSYYLGYEAREIYRIAQVLKDGISSNERRDDGEISDVNVIIPGKYLSCFDCEHSSNGIEITIPAEECQTLENAVEELEIVYKCCLDAIRDSEDIAEVVDISYEFLEIIKEFLANNNIRYNIDKVSTRVRKSIVD